MRNGGARFDEPCPRSHCDPVGAGSARRRVGANHRCTHSMHRHGQVLRPGRNWTGIPGLPRDRLTLGDSVTARRNSGRAAVPYRGL